MDYIKVEGKNQLYRDTYSNGIVNDDKTEYYNYINEYKNKISYDRRIKKLEGDVEEIKNNVLDLKNFLKEILNEPK